LVELARTHTPEAIETLAQIMANADASDSARVSAANSLLDRGWGKPPQTVNQNLGEKRSETDWTRDGLVAFLNDATGRGSGAANGSGDKPEED
jgi:hypothetical protein